MNDVALGGTGAYIINTIINVVKPLIPENKRNFIPIIALLAGVLYGILLLEGTIETKIAGGIAVGSTSIAGHEGSKIFKKENKNTDVDVLVTNTVPNELGQVAENE